MSYTHHTTPGTEVLSEQCAPPPPPSYTIHVFPWCWSVVDNVPRGDTAEQEVGPPFEGRRTLSRLGKAACCAGRGCILYYTKLPLTLFFSQSLGFQASYMPLAMIKNMTLLFYSMVQRPVWRAQWQRCRNWPDWS